MLTCAVLSTVSWVLPHPVMHTAPSTVASTTATILLFMFPPLTGFLSLLILGLAPVFLNM